ncbi:MAG: glycosyltransferase [Flavipsychrobacter sp.]|jgi:cellulose synthase/poly-beta-1,6-N-acetylglucosamine synthase-like glycosyltransferase|nr:glycosyltransferase [Flavipsychrobacter sp.]
MKVIIDFFSRGTFWDVLGIFFQYAVFLYGTSLLIAYGVLAFLSLGSIRRYMKKNANADYNIIIESPLAPGISVIAPAFNEGVTIISNVRSLLTFNYPKFEVIIINDGSTDDTLEKLVSEFELVQVDYAYREKLLSKPVKRIFKSTNPAYDKLVVIDKINGKSKADASNAGINVAIYDYFLCTDVDCILDKDTLIKLIKPFMDAETSTVREVNGDMQIQEDYKRVIACGATLRMVNSCDVDEGLMIRVRPPRRILPRFQEMEYIRAFVLGKMGWDRINSVPNVSGGLGMFDKDIAIKAGGYDSLSLAEDMDLITRMGAFMTDNNKKYSVKYVPITLCWTEGPTTLKVFGRQRTRWGRGLAQLMSTHRKILFSPRYGRMGLIVFPYHFFYELLAPIIEFLGILFYIYLILTQQINWPYAIILIVFVYTYSVMITTIALLWDQITFKYYKTWGETIGLCLMAFLEPFIYHPLIVFFALKGYFNFIIGKKHTWGNMQRQGFSQPKRRTAVKAG